MKKNKAKQPAKSKMPMLGMPMMPGMMEERGRGEMGRKGKMPREEMGKGEKGKLMGITIALGLKPKKG